MIVLEVEHKMSCSLRQQGTLSCFVAGFWRRSAKNRQQKD